MPAGLPSEAAGPLILLPLLVAAGLVAWRRPGTGPVGRPILGAAGLALGLQALHVAEEFVAGFHGRMPALWGLPPWSDHFFVTLNLMAIASWCVAVAALAGKGAALWARSLIWFLGFASTANALAHPALALWARGYFPGLFTALAMIFTGPLLLRRLLQDARGKWSPVA